MSVVFEKPIYFSLSWKHLRPWSRRVLIPAWDSEEDSLSPYYKLDTLPGAALRGEREKPRLCPPSQRLPVMWSVWFVAGSVEDVWSPTLRADMRGYIAARYATADLVREQ